MAGLYTDTIPETEFIELHIIKAREECGIYVHRMDLNVTSLDILVHELSMELWAYSVINESLCLQQRWETSDWRQLTNKATSFCSPPGKANDKVPYRVPRSALTNGGNGKRKQKAKHKMERVVSFVKEIEFQPLTLGERRGRAVPSWLCEWDQFDIRLSYLILTENKKPSQSLNPVPVPWLVIIFCFLEHRESMATW